MKGECKPVPTNGSSTIDPARACKWGTKPRVGGRQHRSRAKTRIEMDAQDDQHPLWQTEAVAIKRERVSVREARAIFVVAWGLAWPMLDMMKESSGSIVVFPISFRFLRLKRLIVSRCPWPTCLNPPRNDQ